MNPKKNRYLFWIIILLTFLAGLIDLPKELPLKISIFKKTFETTIRRPEMRLKLGKLELQPNLDLKKGLDLAGGVHLMFKADMTEVEEDKRNDALEALKGNIERRINLFGVQEASVQTSKTKDSYRVIIELPGVVNTEEAISLIGKTAMLDFREESASASAEATDSAAILPKFDVKTGLTGRHLIKSEVTFDQQTGKPEVAIEFNDEGAKLFADITKRDVGKRVAIFLDYWLISAPTVEEPILEGKAVIRGSFTLEEAKAMVVQLNAGVLPAPIELIEQRKIGPLLGQDSVRKGISAGVLGLAMVILFMAFNYGKLGIIANLGLIIYGLLSLALYKLIPVTLTLPGIAGFLLSIGMAVDSNILIFERMKEEVRKRRDWGMAMEMAFGRAWDSIRDANVCTLITCFILFNPLNWQFLNNSGMVRGFALTLGLGVVLSLFTGVIVTRTLLRVLAKENRKRVEE